MAIENMTWESVCQAIASIYGTDAQTIATTLTNNGVAVGDVEQAFKMLEGTAYEIWYNSDGTVRSYNYIGQPDAYVSGNASGVTQLINSNSQAAAKTAVTIPLNTSPSVADPTKVSFGAGMKQAGNFVLKEILPAVAAANVGITLGKTIDSALYNANPDFWDSHGWGSINPETWASITQGDDSLGASLFNFVYGIDAQNNTSQAYIDQDAFAYLALVLQQLGVFNEGDTSIPENYTVNGKDVGGIEVTPNLDSWGLSAVFSDGTLTPHENGWKLTGSYIAIRNIGTASSYSYTYDNKTATYAYSQGNSLVTNSKPIVNPMSDYTKSNDKGAIAWAVLYGAEQHSAITGIGTQNGATTPSLSNDDTVAEVLAKLQVQYPDLFNNAVTQDVIQPDGSTKTYTYIPVGQVQPNPNPTEGYNPEDQPISANSTQADPEVDPETAPESQLAYLISVLTDLANPNIENTGEGNTPPVVIPTGSASALYTVYNPTESEIQSFGGWLWSANFVDQLLKMFNDPMQAIISLHKVFCSPSVSGRNDIKVGYLNSGVAANVVDNQYVTVDCGSVNLAEQYQSVFDYPPFTDVTIYLPFVGFVKLDTNDVMRGTINVIYHIDVLTGACLAEVKVIRDMFGGVIYQYSGDCSVHYPLSSGSYMGVVSALLGVAGTVASGGALAPMAIGMATGAMSGHANVKRSGSLSGNSGAMGIKKPYLVVQRPQVNTAAYFEQFEGKPSNYTVTIGECTGYIKCKEVHVINTPATESEVQELVSLLKEGVIL